MNKICPLRNCSAEDLRIVGQPIWCRDLYNTNVIECFLLRIKIRIFPESSQVRFADGIRVGTADMPDANDLNGRAGKAGVYSQAETPNKEYLLGVSAREYISGPAGDPEEG